MPGWHGVIQGYNGIATVDDKYQKGRVYREVVLIADSGFNSGQAVRKLLDRGIDAYILNPQFRKRDLSCRETAEISTFE